MGASAQQFTVYPKELDWKVQILVVFSGIWKLSMNGEAAREANSMK